MGVSSNSKVFLSDQKDPKGNMEIHNNEVCQSQNSIQEDHEQLIRLKKLSVQERDPQEEDYNQEEQKQSKVITKPLKLKLEIPSHVGCEDVVDDCNEGFKTPTSSDHKIPVITECPGAPRKQTKSRPVTKRKKACERRLVFDLCKELESLIPMPYGVDLGGDGMNSNKRVKHC